MGVTFEPVSADSSQQIPGLAVTHPGRPWGPGGASQEASPGAWDGGDAPTGTEVFQYFSNSKAV